MSRFEPETARARIDKWLWAARFFKTRSLASDAVDGGKVQLNDTRVKPAKEVKSGDVVRIAIGQVTWIVVVRSVSATCACVTPGFRRQVMVSRIPRGKLPRCGVKITSAPRWLAISG